MSAFIAFRHGHRRFHAVHIPDASAKFREGYFHPAMDENGFVDLESFQADNDLVYGKLTAAIRSSWSPPGTEPAEDIVRSKAPKRYTIDGYVSTLPATPDSPGFSDSSESSSAPSPVENEESLSSKSISNTQQHHDHHHSDGGSTKERGMSADKDKQCQPVTCVACGESLAGMTAYRCVFPTCGIFCCRRCASLLTKHYDDQGAYGDLNALKQILLGATETTGQDEAAKKDEPAKPHPKKVIALGAEFLRREANRRRGEREFEYRWGKRLD